jgi:hypothetical protein
VIASWHELSVYPLFSPQSLIAEGTADFGVRVAFPGPERLAFASSVIFPAAGLDPGAAAVYYEVAELIRKLGYASTEAARRYLDGQMDAAMTASWLQTHALQSPKRAAQQISFFEQYRSYVINYTAGEDLVERWVEARGGTVSSPDQRWALFESLIASPTLPSSLATPTAQIQRPNRPAMICIEIASPGQPRCSGRLSGRIGTSSRGSADPRGSRRHQPS